MKNKLQILSITTMLFILSCANIIAQNLCTNGDFETLEDIATAPSNPMGTCYYDGGDLSNNSPADEWLTWSGCAENYCCVITAVTTIESTCLKPNVNVSGNIMHVTTTAGGAGIDNVNVNTSTASKVKVTAWVYVISGEVSMAIGPTGVPEYYDLSLHHCKWEKLSITANNPDFDFNQVLFFSNDEAAEFYVDNVTVTDISPELVGDEDARLGFENSQLQIITEPASGLAQLHYDFTEAGGSIRLSILSTTGSTILSETLEQRSGEYLFDTSAFAAGMYVAVISDAAGNTVTEKFIIH